MRKNPTYNTAIIGAGIAGIATSIRLALKGHKVTVFEANPYPGGKLSEFTNNGFRFDAGPSLFTLPELVDELFLLAGKNPRHYFQYEALEVACNYFYEDGTRITGYTDSLKFENEVFEKVGEDKANVRKALQNSGVLYNLLADVFMKKPLYDWKTFFNSKALRAYANLHKLDFFRTMNSANEAMFKDQRTVQLFNRYATYNGSDPYQTPATFNIIPHLEFSLGAYFPKGGMYSITSALVYLATSLGVEFVYNTRIECIEVVKNKAMGLKISGVSYPFDRVVSNMDMVNTYKRLLPETYYPKKLLNQPKSSSALIFYWGIRKQFPALELHNIFFSKNYKAEFDYIFKKMLIYSDPTVYINITSKYQPGDAREGCENWFTMINVPNNQGQDWDELIREARFNILSKISRMLDESIEPLIITEDVMDPRLIEERTASSLGALYGNSSNNKFAAFLRHPNHSGKIKNLYFCGGSVHPGGGIPLCLLSAKIVSDVITN